MVNSQWETKEDPDPSALGRDLAAEWALKVSDPVAVLTDGNDRGELSGSGGIAVEEDAELGTRGGRTCVTLVVHHDDTRTLTNGIIVWRWGVLVKFKYCWHLKKKIVCESKWNHTRISPPLCLKKTKTGAIASGWIKLITRSVIATRIRGDEIVANIHIVLHAVIASVGPIHSALEKKVRCKKKREREMKEN